MDPSQKRNFKGRLRNKIFFFMVLIGIVPLAVAVVLTEYVFTNSHREDVAKLEAAVLQEKASAVQNFINQNILAPSQLEIPYGESIFSTSSVAGQNFVIQQSLATAPYLQSESYINLEGQETARVDRAVPTGYPSSSLQNLSGSAAFQIARMGNDYLSPVSYENNTPTVQFASPIRDKIEIIGVISGVATLSPLQSIIGSSTIGNTGYLYVVDQNGVVMAGGGSFAGLVGSSTVAGSSIVQKILAGNDLITPATQMRYKNVFGQSVVAAGVSLSEYGQPWGLVAEWPTSEADASELIVGDIIILLIILVFVLVVLLSILLALFITRPVKKLEEATARVAQGMFNEGVTIRTGDELEELGGSFNAMILGLKQLEALKDEFVFIAAHELKTPVSAMKGYLTLILDGSTGETTEQTKDFIEKVLGSDQRLIQLVNDLLEVARSQAGRLTIKVAPTDLVAPIRSTLDELRSLADENSVKMIYDPAVDLPNVFADADRIKEVMVNLVGNAIKYMGASGTITITHELEGNNLVTHIADTGLGMSEDAQKKLFEKFYRVQTEKTRDIAGTGLGLFIVKEIIDKMGGTISVASKEGKGSTFSFSLPVVKKK